MKEDVKEKSFSPPLGKMRVWRLTSSPTTLLEGVLVWPLWLAAHSSGEASPSCLSQLDGFMKQQCSTPFGYEATQAKRWLKVPTKILCETRGLQLFWVIRGGIGLTRRLGAKLQHTERLMSDSILSLEPEHRTNRWATTEAGKPGRSPGFCSMLKLLAFSVVRRRNVLLSSKVSK